jgi:hypothetical protein
MTNSEFRDFLADDFWASSFQSVEQYRTALLKALDALVSPRTEDEILRFLGSQGFIDGELEQNKDGTLRWAYRGQLNRYDGDDDWEEIDATETILGLIRWIREPSFSGPIPEPVHFRFPLDHSSSGVYVEACDRERKYWVVNYGCYYLNKESKWEKPEPVAYAEFREKFSWPTAEEATKAYCNRPQPLTLEKQQAAEIVKLKAQLDAASGLIAKMQTTN